MSQGSVDDARHSAAAVSVGATGELRTFRRPSVPVLALLVLLSLAVVAGVLILVGLVTGDRLTGGGYRPASASAGRVKPEAAAAPNRRGRPQGRDEIAERLAPLLGSLAEAAGAQAVDEDEEEEGAAEFVERVRQAASLFPIDPRQQGAELPYDLELPDDSRVILVRGGPPDATALVVARVRGQAAGVRDFFAGQARANGFKCSEMPALADGGSLVLRIEKTGGARIITIRPVPSAGECAVAVCDF